MFLTLNHICPTGIIQGTSSYNVQVSVTKYRCTWYIFPKFSIPLCRGVPFLYIAIWSASQPSTCTIIDLPLDAYPIRVLLKVIEYAASCVGIVQGSFCQQCGQLSWCSALNAEVMGTLLGYFSSSLLARFYLLPQYFVFWSKWLA